MAALLGLAGQNAAVHVSFGQVRRPAELSRLLGVDVRGFRHGVSNQALQHVLKEHGNATLERARGQKEIDRTDFAMLPSILASAQYQATEQRAFGPRRVKIIADHAGSTYHYIAEARVKQKRLDLVTMWKR